MISAPSLSASTHLLTEPLSVWLCSLPLCQGAFCLSVLRPQRPGVSVMSTGFGVRTGGTASHRQCPPRLSQESVGRASALHATQCPGGKECDVLLPCVMMIMSAQKGLGNHPSQPSHLASESDPRGGRGLSKVTGQICGRAGARTQAS